MKIVCAILGVVIFCIMGPEELRADSSNHLKKWLAVPQSESAIIFIVSGDIEKSYVILASGESNLASHKLGDQSFFIRQYRMIPGIYQVRLDGWGGVLSVKAQASQTALIKLSLDNRFKPFGILDYFNQNFTFEDASSGTLGAFLSKHSGKLAEPQFIKPPQNALTLWVRAPWEIPKPRPDPVPKPGDDGDAQ